jgi:tetratricopeptide (TPR) repeat protein
MVLPAMPSLTLSLFLLARLHVAALPDVTDEAKQWYGTGSREEADAKLEASAATLGDTLEGAQRTRHLSHIAEQEWRYELALRLNARALAQTERELGKDHLAVADLLEDRARLLRITEKYRPAAEAAQRALTLREKQLGRDHVSLGPLLLVVASAQWTAGKFEEGEATARRAIELAIAGKQPLDQASALNTLGALLQWRHQDVEAERRFREALDVYRAEHAERCAAAAATFNNLGLLLWADVAHASKRRQAEAVASLESALTAAEASLGLRHPFSQQIAGQLVSMYREQGRAVRSLELAERARQARGLSARLCVNPNGTEGCLRPCSDLLKCDPGHECVSLEDVHSASGPPRSTACFVRCDALGVPGADAGCAPGWVCSPTHRGDAQREHGVCAPGDD